MGESMTLYENVAERMQDLIAKGIYEPGERLPSIRRLSSQLRASINTVRDAYSLLESRRIVIARPGSGYFVARLPSSSRMRRADAFRDLSPKSITIDDLSFLILEDAKRDDMISLNLASPHPSMLPLRRISNALARAVSKSAETTVAYDLVPGRYPLRQNIARRMVDAGCAVSADEITITSGCLEAIMITLLALCRPGDTVAIESPVYYSFLQLLETLGLQIIEIPSSAEEGMNIDVLEFAVSHYPVAACITVPNFSNPLGSLMPDSSKERLARLAAERDLPIIEDDIYGEIYFGTERPRALKSFDASDEVVYCSSFSKTIAPGYRLGWVVGGKHTERIRRVKSIVSIATNSVTPVAIEGLLEEGTFDRHLRSARRSYREFMEAVRDSILGSFPSGTRVGRPKGGFVLWVELPAELDAVELYHACREQGVSLAPGTIFSAARGYRNFVRIPYVEWSPRVRTGIEIAGRCARALADHRSRKPQSSLIASPVRAEA